MATVNGVEHWGTYPHATLAELQDMPTLCEAQASNLKIKSDTEEVWLKRTGLADGEAWDNMVVVYILIAGEWIEVEHWEAR